MWSLKLKIKEPDKEIIWPIVLFTMAKAIGISEKILFFAFLGWLLIIIIQKSSLIIPRVNGIWMYISFIIITTFIGLVTQQISSIGAGLYYYVPNVIVIFLGYYLACYYDRRKSLIKTICLSGTIASLFCFAKIVMNPYAIFEFGQLRSIFEKNVYEVCIALGIVLFYKLIHKRVIFSRNFDMLMLVIMGAHIVLSMGRTQIIVVGVEFIVMMAEILIVDKQRDKHIINSVIAIILVIIMCIVAYLIIPRSITDELFDKISNSQEEMNTDQEYNSVDDVVANWRGYENQTAQRQWKNYDVINMIFGAGMGKGLDVKYIPYTWDKFHMLEGKSIPLLHSGYYTTLIKGGIFGLASLILLYVLNALEVLKYKKYNSRTKELLIIMSFATIGVALNTVVMRGIVAQSTIMYWGLIMGWVNRELRLKSNRKYNAL